MKFKRSLGEWTFDFINTCIMVLLMIAAIYPVLYVLFASFSMPAQLDKHVGILLKPLGFTLEGYKLILNNNNIITGYENTLFYVIVGTAVNLIMTALGAYALSRKGFLLRNIILFLITFTMFFSGGIIPLFLILKDMGMINTRWVMVLPGAISVWNLIVMKTSFEAIPVSLEESAKIDGANDIIVLFRIILPISIPIMAVMALFYGIGHWNSWFNAVLYLRSRSLYPLQLFMREILILNNDTNTMRDFATGQSESYSKLVKYCAIIVSTIPVLMVYPFLQKYFVKGIMIGAIKG